MDDIDTPYDPDHEVALDATLRQQLAGKPLDEPLSVRGLRVFTFCLHQGCKRVNYEAHVRPSDGAFFWITNDHAAAIGRALRGSLRAFGLSLTTFEPGAAARLVDSVEAGTRIDEVTFAHKSGDEVTEEEARAFAGLITRVGARIAHLWAGEFDPGSLDVLAAELQRLKNTTVTELDVCDVSLPEPEDRLVHAGLETLAARNRTLD